MFNGVPEQQFHQFIASRTSALPLPLPLTLPVHMSPLPPNFSIHELHQPSHQQLFQSHLLQSLQRQQQPSSHEVEHKHEEVEEEEEEERVVGELEGVRSVPEVMDPWLKEEVLALLTIRSSMGNDFSDFIWGHVSRKLAELGYKRSAEKCKEKFEEVSKYCSNTSYGNYYRSFNELEALFQDQHHKTMDEKMVETNEGEKNGANVEENSANETLENPIEENPEQAVKRPKRKKRKKEQKLEMLKGFSEFVSSVLVQQEQLQKKFLEDIEKKEEERVSREEAWRKQEMDRLDKELEIRAKEQTSACERQVIIIELLKKLAAQFPSQNQGNKEDSNTPKNANPPPPSPSTIRAQNPKSLYRASTPSNPNAPTSSAVGPVNLIPLTTQENSQVPKSSTPDPSIQNPNLLTSTTQNNTEFTTASSQLLALANPNFSSNEREDYGKRWPKDEVNSLINLRCNLQNAADDTKAPLWERISQGMLELGYKRSAKKCKEKWENINKYFRKTKDANKKRPLDSKTCPYFHQLNSLYNQGKLVSPSEGPENQTHSPKNHTTSPQTGIVSSQAGFSEAMAHVDEGDKNMVQVSPLEFEY